MGASFATGCSSSLFESNEPKNDYKPSSGEFHQECLNLKLDEQLNASNVRGLFNCLSSNGSVQEYQQLLSSMTDEELNPLVMALNEELLNHPERLKAIDETLKLFEQTNITQSVFQSLALFLDHNDWIHQALSLMSEMAKKDKSKDLDGEFVIALRILFDDLYQQTVFYEEGDRFLRGLNEAVQLKSYRQLVKSLQKPIALQNSSLGFLAEKILEYSKARTAEQPQLLKKLLLGWNDGSLVKVLNVFFNFKGIDQGVDDQKIYRFNKLVQYLSRNENKQKLKDFISLIQDLNAPIECFGGSKTIPNVLFHIKDEFSKKSSFEAPLWISQSNMLRLMLAQDACDVPESLTSHLSVIHEMNQEDRNLIIAIAEISSALRAGEKQEEVTYRSLLADVLTAPEPIFETHLAPVLGELTSTNREALKDVLYLLNATTLERRQNESAGVFWESLLKRREQFSGRSVYDVLSEKTLKISPATFVKLILKSRDWIDETHDTMPAVMKSLYQIWLLNRKTPLSDFTRSILVDSSKYQRALLTIADLHQKEAFSKTLKLTATMARDGTLYDFLKGLVGMLIRNAEALRIKSSEQMVQQFAVRKYMHQKLVVLGTKMDRSSVDSIIAPDATLFDDSTVPWFKNQSNFLACKAVDFSIPLSHYQHDRWDEQLQLISKCSNHNGRFDEFESSIFHFLQPEHHVKAGLSLPAFIVKNILDFSKNIGEKQKKLLLQKIGSLAIKPETKENFKKLIELNSFWLRESPVSFAQSLFRTFFVLNQEQDSLDRILFWVAGELKRVEAPDVSKTVLKAFQKIEQAPSSVLEHLPAPLPPEVYEDLKDKIAEYEKPNISVRLSKLAQERVDQYWKQVFSWKEQYGFKTADEFKMVLRPLLDSFSRYDINVFKTTLEFFQRLDHAPYTPEWWEAWHHRLTSKVRAIPFYYPGMIPGKDKPRVRLVNNLDMLELVFIEADFSFKQLGVPKYIQIWSELFEGNDPDISFAMKYLSWLGQSGDKLKEYIDRVEKEVDVSYTRAFVGPEFIQNRFVPELRRRLFNLNQVHTVLRELYNTTDEEGRNDMMVVRDLCYDVLRSTPRKHWDTFTKESNSLAFIAELVSFGLMRNVGRQIWYQEDGKVKATRIQHILRVLARLAYVKEGNQIKLNEDTLSAVDFLLRKNWREGPRNQKGELVNFNDRYIFIGQLIDEIFQWIEDDGDFAKNKILIGRSGFHFLDLLDRVITQSEGASAAVVASWVKDVLGTPEGVDFSAFRFKTAKSLALNSETTFWFEEILNSPQKELDQLTKTLAQGMAEGVRKKIMKEVIYLFNQLDHDPLKRWKQTVDLYDEISKNAEYSALSSDFWKNYRNEALDVLENPTQENKILRDQSFKFLSQKFEDGSVSELVRYIGRTSSHYDDEFYKNIRFLGHDEVKKSLQNFMDFLVSGLETSKFSPVQR